MDLHQELSVWRRVRAPEPLSAEEALLPERLERWIPSELETEAQLRRLARQANGGVRATLLRMAERSAGIVRQLTTLHYLLTGRRLRLAAKADFPRAPLPETLRELYLRLDRTERELDDASREFESHAALLAGVRAELQREKELCAALLTRKLCEKA